MNHDELYACAMCDTYMSWDVWAKTEFVVRDGSDMAGLFATVGGKSLSEHKHTHTHLHTHLFKMHTHCIWIKYYYINNRRRVHFV